MLPLAIAGAQGLGNIMGSAMGAYGSWKGNKAAQKEIGKGMVDNTNALNAQNALQQPYATQGGAAFGQAGALAAQGDIYKGPKAYKMGAFGGVNMAEDPGVQYRMDQSNKQLNAGAGAKGQLFSGAQQKALQANSQNLASQEFGNAYNRQYGQFKDTETAGRDQYNLDRANSQQLDRFKMGDLMDQGQMGYTAATQIGANTGNANQNQMMLRGQAADAAAKRAAGPWGAMGNAMGGLANTGANMATSYMMGKK